MSICLNDLIEQLQRIREDLNEKGFPDRDPEVVISDASARCAKNFNIQEEVIGGADALLQAGKVYGPEDDLSNATNYVYLFGGRYEHPHQRYTPRDVMDAEC